MFLDRGRNILGTLHTKKLRIIGCPARGNTTRMHYKTNLSKEYDGKTQYGLYANGMVELDDQVGDLLNELKDADNTIVMFSTDNGAASNSWPDGGNQPFHGEKGAGGWEGGFRVPMLVKWPGHIPADVSTGEFMTMEDWMPTLMSMVGDKTLKEDLLVGKQAGEMTYKVHLDGYDQTDLLLHDGKTKRKDFYYFTESTFHGLRYGDWKMLFVDQEEWFRAEQVQLSRLTTLLGGDCANCFDNKMACKAGDIPAGGSLDCDQQFVALITEGEATANGIRVSRGDLLEGERVHIEAISKLEMILIH